MNKIKVLEMIDQPFLGGGQANLLSLARFLDKALFDVSVCCREGGPLVEEVDKSGLKHYPIPFHKKIDPRVVGDIVRLLRENHFDILHTHGGVAGLYGRCAGRRCRVPVIIHTLHGIHYLHYRNPLWRYVFVLLERYFSAWTDALVLVSQADRHIGLKKRLAAPEKMFVIENGIDFSAYSVEVKKDPVLREFGITSARPLVGTVARLHRQKGLCYLVEAARKISLRYPDLAVLIAGEGPERRRLERLIKRTGLTRSVLLLGERKDAARILSSFDIFVLPSLWEGLPYALIEAGACGKAVVASDIEGIKEIIKDGETGVLFDPKDSAALAESIIRLQEDERFRDRIGGNLRRAVRSRFALSRMVRQTQDLYLRLLEEKLPQR
jgi:glycosyltransferase involved in cell wall biosynthesis